MIVDGIDLWPILCITFNVWKSSLVDESIAADHAYLENCQTEWVDKRPSLMNGKKYIFHFVSSQQRKAYFRLQVFLLATFSLGIVYFDLQIHWKLYRKARAIDCEYFSRKINFSIRKVSDRWRIARYGIWLIFFHISVFSARFEPAIEIASNRKMAYWNEKWCQFICSILSLSAVTLTHTHIQHTAIRILPVCFYLSAHLNVILSSFS